VLSPAFRKKGRQRGLSKLCLRINQAFSLYFHGKKKNISSSVFISKLNWRDIPFNVALQDNIKIAYFLPPLTVQLYFEQTL
jgi:hypothetical protein